MTPKEKALDIFNRMCNSVDELLPLDVKGCALIAAEEAQDAEYNVLRKFKLVYDGFISGYWESVKRELENL